jgi:hypothetical protein
VKGLFQQLQSKWIYRIAGGYIVSAWVILQVAAIVFPSLELPSWTIKVVLDVLLLGFVPVLLLGWHLDLRRARAERSSVLKKDAAGDPQSPSEHTLQGEGRAGLDARRPAMQTAPHGETPEKISLSRLPITGSEVFGREEDLAFLDRAWANQHINVVTIVAWAGVGKSTLVNHWLERMAAEHYRSAALVFGWSFYRQGSSGGASSADEFWTLRSLGLEIQIHGSERRGRRAKDWLSSSHIVELCWCWMAWSRSKIRLVHKKDGYVSLPSRRFCANSLLSIRGFASLPRGCRSLILLITSASRPCVVSWNNYPAMPVRSCSERWA